MAPLQLLGQDDQTDMLQDIFGHVMPLALASASYVANDIISGSIAFVWSNEWK